MKDQAPSLASLTTSAMLALLPPVSELRRSPQFSRHSRYRGVETTDAPALEVRSDHPLAFLIEESACLREGLFGKDLPRFDALLDQLFLDRPRAIAWEHVDRGST